jgi:hypothetical protein
MKAPIATDPSHLLREETARAIDTAREEIRSAAHTWLNAGHVRIAGHLLAIERWVYIQTNELWLGFGLTPPPTVLTVQTPNPVAAKCRHKWGMPAVAGGRPACDRCGVEKSAQGRPKGPVTATVAGVTEVDPPSAPLPLSRPAHDYERTPVPPYSYPGPK